MRTLSEVAKDTGKGAARGAFWGAVIGVGCVLAAPITGGTSLTGLLALLPAATGTALFGAKVGGVAGGILGIAGEEKQIDKIAAGVIAVGLGNNVLGDGARNVKA